MAKWQALLQFKLGQVYLALAEPQKAQACFDRAFEMRKSVIEKDMGDQLQLQEGSATVSGSETKSVMVDGMTVNGLEANGQVQIGAKQRKAGRPNRIRISNDEGIQGIWRRLEVTHQPQNCR